LFYLHNQTFSCTEQIVRILTEIINTIKPSKYMNFVWVYGLRKFTANTTIAHITASFCETIDTAALGD